MHQEMSIWYGTATMQTYISSDGVCRSQSEGWSVAEGTSSQDDTILRQY